MSAQTFVFHLKNTQLVEKEPTKKGACHKELHLRELEGLMKASLRSLSGSTSARMEWERYWSRIVVKHQVALEGWPYSEVRFTRLGRLSTSDLRLLLKMWKDGALRFRKINRDEFEQLEQQTKQLIAEGILSAEAPKKVRKDRLTKKIRANPETRGKKRRGTIKSKEFVDESDDRDVAVAQ